MHTSTRGIERWSDEPFLLEVAVDDDGRRRLRAEVRGRRWAADLGVRSPDLVAAAPGGDWLLSRWAARPGGLTPALLQEAVGAALAMETGPVLSADGATSWAGRRRSLPLRARRLAAERLPLRAFLEARHAAQQLPEDGMAHGDLHPGNVYVDGQGLLVADWEYLAPAPRGTDLMRLWSTCRTAPERETVLDAALSGASRERAQRLGVLGRWLALRLLAEAATGPPSPERTLGLAVARAVIKESRLLPDA